MVSLWGWGSHSSVGLTSRKGRHSPEQHTHDPLRTCIHTQTCLSRHTQHPTCFKSEQKLECNCHIDTMLLCNSIRRYMSVCLHCPNIIVRCYNKNLCTALSISSSIICSRSLKSIDNITNQHLPKNGRNIVATQRGRLYLFVGNGFAKQRGR